MRRLGFLCVLALSACRSRAPEEHSPPAPQPAATPAPSSVVPSSAAKNEIPAARIGVRDARVLIHERPSGKSAEIGALHLGDVVTLRKDSPEAGPDCEKGWYATEPEGWVCLDSRTTLDVDRDPVLGAKRAHHGNFSTATPFHWGASREALLYKRLPTALEQRKTEYELDKHLRRVDELRTAREAGKEPERAFAALEGVDVTRAAGALPEFFAGGALTPRADSLPRDSRAKAKWVPTRSAVAWTDEFFAEGRSWVLTEDLMIAPKDKLVALEPSEFEGVHLDGEHVELPIAFMRREPRPKFRFVPTARDVTPAAWEVENGSSQEDADEAPEAEVDEIDPLAGFREDLSPGKIEESASTWPRLGWVGLTGRFRKQGRTRYLETSDGGFWLREQDATLIQPEPPRGFELEDGEKWLDVSIFRGTLVAYEGTRAVFATLISPGANGYKRENGAFAKYTTPTGTFRIEWKHLSTTMTPDPERMSYYLSEVPFTQFFHMPFALHAAYWHDRFGEPKSGGCVNLSPKDAKWLFEWTTPALPEGWHGVRSGGERGPGTWVRVR